MSLELCDLRAKVTLETDAVLEAFAATKKKDKSEVVREILQEWADEQIEIACHIFGLLPRLQPIDAERPVDQAWARREPINRSLRLQIFERDGGACSYCKAELAVDEEFHIDHVVPVAKGGTNEVTNLVLACRSCNLAKSAKTIEEWKAA